MKKPKLMVRVEVDGYATLTDLIDKIGFKSLRLVRAGLRQHLRRLRSMLKQLGLKKTLASLQRPGQPAP